MTNIPDRDIMYIEIDGEVKPIDLDKISDQLYAKALYVGLSAIYKRRSANMAKFKEEIKAAVENYQSLKRRKSSAV